MPDRDVIRSGVAPSWCKPLRLIRGEAEPEEVARAILSSVARCLREEGGLVGQEAFVALLQRCQGGQVTGMDVFTQLRDVVRDFDGHRHANIADRAAQTIIARLRAGHQLTGTVGEALAEEFCQRLVNHHLFDRIRVKFPRHAQSLPAYEEVVRPHLAILASRLARTPDAQVLRAPRIRYTARKSMSILLHSPIN